MMSGRDSSRRLVIFTGRAKNGFAATKKYLLWDKLEKKITVTVRRRSQEGEQRGPGTPLNLKASQARTDGTKKRKGRLWERKRRGAPKRARTISCVPSKVAALPSKEEFAGGNSNLIEETK